jgi:hypothetical protein
LCGSPFDHVVAATCFGEIGVRSGREQARRCSSVSITFPPKAGVMIGMFVLSQ